MSTNRLHELTRAECLELLGTSAIGRVVYTNGALPVCTPVNYLMHGNSIIFRTSRRSRVAAAVRDAVVAFEVDHIDPVSHTGWSVLATGTATSVEDSSTLLRLEQTGLVPWAGGERDCWIRIIPALLTGRHLRGPGVGVPVAAVGYRVGF